MEQTPADDEVDGAHVSFLSLGKIPTKKACFIRLSVIVIVVVAVSVVSQMLSLFSALPAFADSGPQPTNVQSAIIGNKRVSFFVKFDPPILTGYTKQQEENVLVRLFDANTNETIKFTTFYISITKGIDPNAEPILADKFLTESGILTLKIHRQQEGPITINANRDPNLNAYQADQQGGIINVNGPILLESGLYHFRMTVMTVDSLHHILDPHAAPVFDVYQSVAGEYMYNVRNNEGNSVYPITITSFSGKVKVVKFDTGSNTFSWAIPFDLNATTIEENTPKDFFVHEDVKIPKSFPGIDNNTGTAAAFNAKVNGKIISSRMIAIDPFSDNAKSVTLHYLINKNELLDIAKENNNNNDDSQSMPISTMTFSFSAPATTIAKMPESLTSQGAFLVIGIIMGTIMLVQRLFRRFVVEEDRHSHVRRFFERSRWKR